MPEFQVTKEDYTMTAKVLIVGIDLFIVVTGGDNPHIGTVTTLSSQTDIQTIRYPSHDGRFHKDDILAYRIAKIIKSDLPGSCTITSGVHVNHISKKQIMVSSSMAVDLGQQILKWLKSYKFNATDPIYYSDNENPK
ncbi:prenylated flavin chaperone LpdD [Companilactobacillus baiquanensis]|uniref:Amino acid decarboxylase n=1 Tax=Companilactobacillus baiquanensis TaxID=2486005 RepID=A0ABW1UXM4_9LACO|nr:amino acid decarboxylase [Companilactobacillus baiquanensis]